MSKKGKAVASKKQIAAKPSSKLAKALKQPALPAKPVTTCTLVHLVWLHGKCAKYSCLPLAVVREIADYMRPPPQFFTFTQATLITFNPDTGNTIKVPLEKQLFRSRFSYVQISKTTLLCCGGMSNSQSAHRTKIGGAMSEVFTVDTVTGRIAVMPEMTTARDKSGLIVVRSVVYVFGGEDNAKVSAPCALTCELLEAGSSWRLFGTMNVRRWSFNPCLWHGEIYLCFGLTWETYVLETSTFRSLDLQVPELKLTAITYVHRDELVVVSNGALVKLTHRNDALVATTKTHDAQIGASSCPPLIWRDTVHLSHENTLQLLDADTATVKSTRYCSDMA